MFSLEAALAARVLPNIRMALPLLFLTVAYNYFLLLLTHIAQVLAARVLRNMALSPLELVAPIDLTSHGIVLGPHPY